MYYTQTLTINKSLKKNLIKRHVSSPQGVAKHYKIKVSALKDRTIIYRSELTPEVCFSPCYKAVCPLLYVHGIQIYCITAHCQ